MNVNIKYVFHDFENFKIKQVSRIFFFYSCSAIRNNLISILKIEIYIYLRICIYKIGDYIVINKCRILECIIRSITRINKCYKKIDTFLIFIY